MSARGRGARRKRGGQLTGSRDGRGGGHAGALGFSARKPGRRWRRPERASERRREERRGGGRGAGTRGDRPRRGKGKREGTGPAAPHPARDVEPAAGGARAGAPPASGEGKAASSSRVLRCRFPLAGTRGSGQGPLGGRC